MKHLDNVLVFVKVAEFESISKAARAQGFSIAMASVAHRDRLGSRLGSGTASSFLANLETLMRNYRWIFCPILKSGMDPLLCHQ